VFGARVIALGRRRTQLDRAAKMGASDLLCTSDPLDMVAEVKQITNKRGGKVTQVITNVLSADGNRIDNTYKNYNEQGEPTTTTTAVYERIP